MAGAAQRMRDFQGPAFLSHGFRPFFLASAVWAVAAMLIWIPMLTGIDMLPTAFDPFSWHAHEFLFGYLGAVIAGFVLTAVPNWTGRLPVKGGRLAALAGLWLLGRIAVAVSAGLPWLVTMLADMALAVVLFAFIAREVMQGKNWRNLPVVGLIALYGLANLLFHIEAHRVGTAYEGPAMRLGLATVLVLVALIGGRIIPSFTRNWLAARRSETLPQPFNTVDKAVLAITLVSLFAFVAMPEAAPTRWLMLLAGGLHLYRLSRWCGWQVRAEPLLWVLHLAYLLLGLGFLAEAAAGFGMLPLAAARHVWLAGGIGLMTLAVMCRATLGHTGRELQAGRATTLIYLAMLGSVVARLLAGVLGNPIGLLHLSGGLWLVAYLVFIWVYGPMLLQPRAAKKMPSQPGVKA